MLLKKSIVEGSEADATGYALKVVFKINHFLTGRFSLTDQERDSKTSELIVEVAAELKAAKVKAMAEVEVEAEE